MLDAAQLRLLAAIGVSVLLHVWLAQTLPATQAPAGRGQRDAPLTASLARPSVPPVAPVAPVALVAPAAPTLAPLPQLTAADATVAPAPSLRTTAPVVALPTPPAPPTPPTPPTSAAASSAPARLSTPAGETNALLTPPGDPTYYTALNLDEYPKAATPLDLGAIVNASAAGQVRAKVFIDETGAVNEVREMRAGNSDLAQAARELLLRTRFTPARKEGRIVKAAVVVSLDYGGR